MTPWVRTLLTANVFMFFATAGWPGLANSLVLYPPALLFQPWSIFTYMFLHAGISHLFWNMLMLFFFGPRLESRLGGGHFLALYLCSGIMAAIGSILFSPGAAVVGASGALYGVMLGYVRYWPRDIIHIWGIIPVEARTLLFVLTAIDLGSGLSRGGSGIAHFAHLGGFVGGWFYLVWMDLRSPARRFKEIATAQMRGGGRTDIQRWQAINPDGLHPINREELARLLERIAAGEAGTLTPDEKAFLNRLAG